MLGDLQIQRPPFTVHLDYLNPTDIIKEFYGVIGQDGELIHAGDYVELRSAHHEVCTAKCDNLYMCKYLLTIIIIYLITDEIWSITSVLQKC